MILPEPHPAAFDEAIVRRHFPASWLEAEITGKLGAQFTDEALRKAIPHPSRPEMSERILGFLEEIRALGVLQPMTAGPDRGIREAQAWNSFVADGREGLGQGGHALMRTPLPKAIWLTLMEGAQDLAREGRRSRKLGWGEPVLMEGGVLPALAQKSEDQLALVASGQRQILAIDTIPCPKTDAYFSWAEGSLFAPVLGEHDDKGVFQPIAPFEAPKPLRHLAFTLPSGVLLAADWFRLPGFTEAVEQDEGTSPSINSDLGVDLRTKDHFERLGLLRVHTTNCVPALVQDGDAVRVGHFNDEDDAFYTEEGERNEVPLPEVVGRVCCDLWDVTFSDREILIDLLEKGGQFPDREAAAAALDAYADAGDVARLIFEPGSTLHLYMATGGEVSLFAETFRSPDLSDWPGMEDMFVLSTKALSVDPALVEEVDWACPASLQSNLETPSP